MRKRDKLVLDWTQVGKKSFEAREGVFILRAFKAGWLWWAGTVEIDGKGGADGDIVIYWIMGRTKRKVEEIIVHRLHLLSRSLRQYRFGIS